MSSENLLVELKHKGKLLKSNVPFLTLKCQSYNHNADRLTAEGGGGGYFWPLEMKLVDRRGFTISSTTRETPIVVRDDHGYTDWVLCYGLYVQFGEPPAVEREGNGFNYRIRHLKLTDEAAQNFLFYFKFVGLDMEWQRFYPSFFPPPNADAGENNLSVLNTIGWKGQAELNEQGIGIISNGTSRYVIMDKKQCKRLC
jgi:hypothetical protein